MPPPPPFFNSLWEKLNKWKGCGWRKSEQEREGIWECLGCPLKLCGKNEAEGSLTGCKRSGIFQLALVRLLAAISDAHSGAKRLENTSNVQETNMWLRQGQVLL